MMRVYHMVQMYHYFADLSRGLDGKETGRGNLYHMNRREELNAVVKDSITTAFLELLEKEPFDNIAITDLTKRAGVGRISFYRNFESKEDVIRKHLSGLVDIWTQALNNEEQNLIEEVFNFFYGHRELFLLLYRRGLAHLSLQCIKDACGPKPEYDNGTAYTAAFIAYGLYGWAEEWFHRGMVETPAEMALMFAETTKHGL